MSWATKGGMAILDQGLITGSNFFLSILLARWLSHEQYGAFGVAFAIFLLLATLYQALVLEPMAVFGASIYRNHLRSYLSGLIRMYLCISIVIFLILGIAAEATLVAGLVGLPGALAGAALAAPGVLLLWLARRTFYLQLSPTLAVCGALLYCGVLISGLYLARDRGLLSPLSALTLTGVGGLLAGALLLMFLSRRLEAGTVVLALPDVWKRHWKYGRWALASAAAIWIPSNLYYLLLSHFSGMAAAGELRALMNFASPLFQSCAALSLLLIPYAARVQSQKGDAEALTWKITLLHLSGAVVYWALVAAFKEPAFRLLYSGKYLEVVNLIPIVGLASIFWSAFFGPATVLQGMQSPGSVFTAAFISSLFCFAVGIPATWAFGVRGAVWSMMFSGALAFAIAVLLVRRRAHTVRVRLRLDGGYPSTQPYKATVG
jgi:O-antigen/teichoic acid export membrane protein